MVLVHRFGALSVIALTWLTRAQASLSEAHWPSCKPKTVTETCYETTTETATETTTEICYETETTTV